MKIPLKANTHWKECKCLSKDSEDGKHELKEIDTRFYTSEKEYTILVQCINCGEIAKVNNEGFITVCYNNFHGE